jgi:hypothetical protein
MWIFFTDFFFFTSFKQTAALSRISKSLQYFLGGYCFVGEGVGDHAGMGGFIR